MSHERAVGRLTPFKQISSQCRANVVHSYATTASDTPENIDHAGAVGVFRSVGVLQLRFDRRRGDCCALYACSCFAPFCFFFARGVILPLLLAAAVDKK